ncbi:MAG TPA: hypothetical protein VJN72_05730 [Gaiellales bacterium]|nr:hypothetical protein [Gaiellales bacterium]
MMTAARSALELAMASATSRVGKGRNDTVISNRRLVRMTAVFA